MAMEDSFYQTLDLSKNEIRLLILNSLDESGIVSGQVIHSNILSGPEQSYQETRQISGYEALSYEWGLKPDISSEQGTSESGPDSFQQVILEGKVVNVRVNLYFALRQLRLPGKSRVLWVDALCIDQKNDRERNHQVVLMRNIYTQANRVIVWLGMKKPKVPNPLRRMRDFVKFYLNAPPAQDEAEKRAFQAHSDSLDFKYLSVWYQFPTLSYWTRLWIIQEFVLAKDLLLCLDDAVIDLENFRKFCAGVEHLQQQEQWKSTQFMNTFDNGIAMHLYRQRISLHDEKKGGSILSLFNLMEKYGECKCMDVRDRVFGLHALSPQCCRDLTPVDYSVPSSNICAKLLRHYLVEHYGANESASDNIDCSGLFEKCRALCQTLCITPRDILLRAPIEEEVPSIKVTGEVIGTVCSSSTFGLSPGIFKTPHFHFDPDYQRDIALQNWDVRPLTLKIYDQVWSISAGQLYESDWLQWWGRAKVPDMLRKCMTIPFSRTRDYQPRFLNISDPAELSRMLQRDEIRQEESRDRVASETRADEARPNRIKPNDCNLPSLQNSLNELATTRHGPSTAFFITNGMILSPTG